MTPHSSSPGEDEGRVEPVLGQTQKANSCEQGLGAASAAGRAPGEHQHGVWSAGLAGPSGGEPSAGGGMPSAGGGMPSAAPPPQQLGVLRSAPTHRPERSILGIPNPEWCYCSSAAGMERAKPRQQALCPSPTPILRATTASLHSGSKGTPDKLSSEMAFFPGNPRKQASG